MSSLLKRRFRLLKFEKMILVLKKFIRSPSLLSPMWQKLPYIYNNFFWYNNLSITFLNYCTIEKSPVFIRFQGARGLISNISISLKLTIDVQWLCQSQKMWKREIPISCNEEIQTRTSNVPLSHVKVSPLG